MMGLDTLDSYNSAGEGLDKGLFFVFGQARSGTTWFSTFMTHGGSFCFHELSIGCHGTGRAKAQRDKFPKFKGRDLYTRQMLRLLYLYPSLCRRMIHKLYSRSDLMSVGNSDAAVFHLCSPLHRLLPGARFAGIYRNGMDQALSAAHMQNRSFEDALTRWKKATERLFSYINRLGGIAVNMDLLWAGQANPVQIWDFLTRGKATECDIDHATKMCSRHINVGGHDKPGGETVAERWHNLAPDLKDTFSKVAGDYIMTVPGFENWPEVGF